MKSFLFAGFAGAIIVVAAGCNSGQPQHTHAGYQHDVSNQHAAPQQWPEQQTAFMGPRGPEGPVGHRGARGSTGHAGPAGYAVAGPRGEVGAIGARGWRGYSGARGSAGELATGPTGAVGPTGAAGARGYTGQAGARGASAAGYAGPAGPAGPRGARGVGGDTGAQGATLVGPAGRAGHYGSMGERGRIGETGDQGSTTAGVAGPRGVAGAKGPQGQAGRTGRVGPVGILTEWTSYREFRFSKDQSTIHESDAHKAAEIAAYMEQSRSLEVGLDGSMTSETENSDEMKMSHRRVKAVRNALVGAGVPKSRISRGDFGDPELRHNGRVGVLLKTSQSAKSE